MDYTRGPGGRNTEEPPAIRTQDMQSVQNLEAVINEGLRVALSEETPDQSLAVPAWQKHPVPPSTSIPAPAYRQ